MINKLLCKLGVNSKKEFYRVCIQFIKFGAVGISNTLISIVVYYLCIFLGLHYILSNSVAFIISVLNAYFWNSRYVFKSNKKYNIVPMIKVFISYGFTFVLGTILLFIWVDCIGISKIIAPLVNLIITIPLNFVLNKFWAFK